MSPDGTSLDLAPEEEQDLFEVANLFPRTTGLPVTVWVSPRGGARHDVRIKVARTPGDRMDIADAAVVGVPPQPALLYGELKAEVVRAVFAWASMNREALVAYWDGELDNLELGGRLLRYDDGPGRTLNHREDFT